MRSFDLSGPDILDQSRQRMRSFHFRADSVNVATRTETNAAGVARTLRNGNLSHGKYPKEIRLAITTTNTEACSERSEICACRSSSSFSK
jgi:hypothetical protein